MKLSALYQIFLDCQLVTTDSRNCPEGSILLSDFLSIQGYPVRVFLPYLL